MLFCVSRTKPTISSNICYFDSDAAKMPEPSGSEQPSTSPPPSKARLKMSVQFALSLAVLILAAITYFVSLATTNWSASGQVLKMGIWEFCVMNDGNGSWKCYPCIAGKISVSNPIYFQREFITNKSTLIRIYQWMISKRIEWWYIYSVNLFSRIPYQISYI